ncbi:hypothetical protein Z946_1038 [Sulfitobacter noctilucicola]|nr:hypothetical protein Z946_1038 [Sulfitobacter noctilucicola]
MKEIHLYKTMLCGVGVNPPRSATFTYLNDFIESLWAAFYISIVVFASIFRSAFYQGSHFS